MSDPRLILNQFGIDSPLIPFGNGHINDTYITEDRAYILQRINTSVFNDPQGLTDNVVLITGYLKTWLSANGGDPERETLTPIPAKNGEWLVRTDSGKCYRLYKTIQGTVSYDSATPELLYQAAKGFGKFQKMLSGFPADRLKETIPNFHNTRSRFEALRSAVNADVYSRVALAKSEVDFCYAREADTDVIVNGIADGRIPLRVTHNDTKLNNVMMDKETGAAVCVIDLDTVMPGSLLYDYGDALRFGASTAAEDERDLSLVHFDLKLFETFTKGFLEELGDRLTASEAALLPFSVKLITLECGMRFLTDYLSGDTYFKTSRPGQNLDRCRTQLKLVAEIEEKTPEMKRIVSDILEGLCK
jgi:hypothetical protein